MKAQRHTPPGPVRSGDTGVDTFAIVRPEHLNHNGNLFGGRLLQWVDEFAWIAAARDYRGNRLVTLALDQVEFRQPVASGAIVRFHVQRVHQGHTSVRYAVTVFADEPGATAEKFVFSTTITFVGIDARGRKKPLKPSRAGA